MLVASILSDEFFSIMRNQLSRVSAVSVLVVWIDGPCRSDEDGNRASLPSVTEVAAATDPEIPLPSPVAVCLSA